jgi:hypothetical protein
MQRQCQHLRQPCPIGCPEIQPNVRNLLISIANLYCKSALKIRLVAEFISNHLVGPRLQSSVVESLGFFLGFKLFLRLTEYQMKNTVMIVATSFLLLATACSGDQNSEISSDDSLTSIETDLENTEAEKQDQENILTTDDILFYLQELKLTPEGTTTEDYEFLALSDYEGHEDSCGYFAKAESFVCVQDEGIYYDLDTANVEWGPHIRSRHLRINTHVRATKTVRICGTAITVSALAYVACVATTGAVAAACVATGPACTAAVGTAAGMCNVSYAVIAASSTACLTSL